MERNVLCINYYKSFILDSGIEVKQENVRKAYDGRVQVHRSKHTVLTPDNVALNELKEDSDEKLKPSIINSPLKQNKFNDKVMKGKDKDEKNQSLSKCKKSEIKNPNELSQPRTKRRRLLSSAAHNSCAAKETDTRFPFSPVYKKTRSFHMKTLPTSSLTIQQKSSMLGSEKGKFALKQSVTGKMH